MFDLNKLQEFRAAWLQERRQGVGASDAPAIMGLDPRKTALDIYLDKIGETVDDEIDEFRLWGVMTEEANAALFTLRTGIELVPPERRSMQHATRPWMRASFDRRYKGGDRRPVQFKWVHPSKAKDWGEEGTDEIPEPVLVQVHHEMEVAGVDVCDVGAVIGGPPVRIYKDIRRSDRLTLAIVDREAEFWAKVQDRIPPEPDFTHHSTLATLKAMYPIVDVEAILDDPKLVGIVAARTAAQQAEKAAHDAKDRCTAELLHAMKGAGLARLLDGTLLRRKEISETEVSYTRKAYKQLYISRPKKARAS